MSLTCGIDWAEAHHDVALIDEHGVVVARSRIDTGAAGFSALLALIAEHGGGVDDTPVAVETDKNLIFVALVEAGFTVYPINPRGVARYRERYGQAGGKSDPGDAPVLAHVLRTDRHMHRRLPANTSQASTIKVLARQHHEAIWALHQTVSRLRSVLLEFYPQALQAFSESEAPRRHDRSGRCPDACRSRKADQNPRGQPVAPFWPWQPARAGGADSHRTEGTDAASTEVCRRGLRAHRARACVGAVVAMRTATDELEKALACEFDQHPLSDLLRSVPGLGPVIAARVLAEIGDDSTRFDNPRSLRAYAGTAPVTIACGRSHYVKARKVRNTRLADACHWWAFTTLTKSVDARAHYDKRRAAGDHHNAALQNLANKLIGRLWWCLINNQPWDEQGAWPLTTNTDKVTAA